MKRTLIGALCLAFLAIGCDNQPPPETDQDPQATSEVTAGSPDVPMAEADANAEDAAEAEKIKARMLAVLEEKAVKNAIQAHDVETMRKVLKKGTDLTFQSSGNTYATECVLANFPEGLRVLKEFGFDFDMRNNRNGAPALLCVAAEGGNFDRLEMARVLLECGASVDAEVMDSADPSLDGLTPFYLAMSRAIMENDEEAFDVARFLLEHGADPDSSRTHDGGQTMLQTAIFEKNLPAVELLLKHGASVTKARDDGATALKIAAQDGTPTEIRQAIAVKAKVCDFTIFGITLGLPLPKEIDDTVSWAFDDQETTWIMSRPFRRFKTAELKRTVDSHRIIAITLVCEMNSELQRKEEIRAVQEALEQKFGLKFLPKWTPFRDIYWVEAYEDGAKVEIRSGPGGDGGDPGRVILTVSVADESVLRWLDDFSAPSVETDLDVL